MRSTRKAIIGLNTALIAVAAMSMLPASAEIVPRPEPTDDNVERMSPPTPMAMTAAEAKRERRRAKRLRERDAR